MGPRRPLKVEALTEVLDRSSGLALERQGDLDPPSRPAAAAAVVLVVVVVVRLQHISNRQH